MDHIDVELQCVKNDVKHLKAGLQSVVQRVDQIEAEHLESKKLQSKQEVTNGPVTLAADHLMETDEPGIQTFVVDSDQKELKVFTVAKNQSMAKSTSYHKVFGQANGFDASQGINYYLDHQQAEGFRLVGIRKPAGSDPTLGISLTEKNGQFVISSIAENSPVAKLSLLNAGDTILGVNGVGVTSVQQALELMSGSKDGFQLKILPAHPNLIPVSLMHIKAYFDYQPEADKEIPSKQIGLPFRGGDILQVISKDDEHYWQARKVYDSSQIGLIPSSSLQRGAHEQITSMLYEEVGRLSPYGRRVLVLIGASGVGRRTLKARLLCHDPLHFATITPYTSRQKRDGEQNGREYNFVAKDVIKREVDAGEFLEWGEFNGNFYGTKLESVRDVVKTGRMCVLDCSPQAIRHIYTWEFMPYIVFVSPPPLEELKALYASPLNHLKPKTASDLASTSEYSQKLETTYKHFFDLILTNRNAEVTFRRLLDALETLKTQQQWVPLHWIHA